MTLLEADPGPDERATTVAEQAQGSGDGGLTLSRSIGIVVALIGFVLGGAALADNSLLTHLATGDLILDRRSVPSVDPYSGTAAGLPWTVQSWLISVIYALSDRVIGLAGVRLLHGVVGAAIAGGLWQLTGSVRAIVPRFLLTAMPLLLGAGFWSPRPLMFGLLAMVVLLQVIELNRPPVIVVPLMWLWANSHGSYPLAFVLLGAVVSGAILDSWLAGERALPRRELRIVSLAIIGTLAAVIGPLGFRVLTFPFQLLSRRESLDGVIEWQAPTFKTPWELFVLGLVPLMIVSAKRDAGWRAIAPALIFLLTAFLATRNIAVAAIVLVVMIAPSFDGLFGTIDGAAAGVLSRTLGKAAAVGLAVAAVAVLVSPALELKWYPEAEVDFLEERGLVPAADGGPIVVHRDAVGNYLTYRFGDRASVFIDDRFDFYPQAVIDDHLTLLKGGDVGEVLDRRGAEVILWQAEETLVSWLADSPEWETALRSDDWIVACRVGSESAQRCLR